LSHEEPRRGAFVNRVGRWRTHWRLRDPGRRAAVPPQCQRETRQVRAAARPTVRRWRHVGV